MSNYSGKATAPQIEAAAAIERELGRLMDMAMKTDLRFLVYLLEMAHDEAAAIARGRRDQAESAQALAHKE